MKRIEHVRPGMDCVIRLDAARDIERQKVEKCSEYPLPSVSRYTSHIKEYGTDIVITDPPLGFVLV